MKKALDKTSFSGPVSLVESEWTVTTGADFFRLAEAGRFSLGEIDSILHSPAESLLDRILRAGTNRLSSRAQMTYRSCIAPPWSDNKLINKNRNNNHNEFGRLMAADQWRFSHDQS